MKQLTEKKKSINIWKWLAAGSVVFIAVFSVITGIFLHRNAKDEQKAESEETVLKVETEAVINEAKAEERKFLNRPAPAVAGDNRQVFRIIEVIPHEACSFFPYLVEWGTEEEYDKNTPLGYDGILLWAQMGSWGGGEGFGSNMFSKKDTIARNSRPFTYVDEKETKEYFDKLTDYDVDIYSDKDDQRGGKWFRKTKNPDNLTEPQTYGYFEYVGAGKGLYYINVSLAAGDVFYPNPSWKVTATSENSINYQIQAVPRAGTEKPKGYMYVCNSAYYWSKDSGSKAKPRYNGLNVVGSTDYNYDLKFAESESGTYVVDNAVYSAVPKEGFDYALSLDSSAIGEWESGFYYQKGGFYRVEDCEKADNGKYIRFSDTKKDDGYTDKKLNLDKGYFLKVTADQYPEAARYNVTFTAADEGAGFYMAYAPENYSSNNFSFIYQGEGKGSYRVSFIYAPKTAADDLAKRYIPEVVKVSVGKGEYALTTTTVKDDGTVEYSDKEGVSGAVYDYAEVILNIGAVKGENNNEAVDGISRMGVTTGGEYGGWVFVPLKSEEDMEQTFLKDIKKDALGENSNTDKYFKPGTKIFVTNQTRVYRYYCRAGLENNEWFKLFCFCDNPESDPNNPKPYTDIINGVGYDFDKTVEENMSNVITKQLLSAFDGQYRIEIIQKEPQNLTKDDVTSADLIYISNQQGINGMSGNWNNISARLKDESLPYCGWNTECIFTEEQDISSDVLMTLYDECIYKRNRAIMVSPGILKHGNSVDTWPVTRNLSKLFHMLNFFDEARNWAYFMPEAYPDIANSDYSKIRSNNGVATVDVHYPYNKGFSDNGAEYGLSTWRDLYFDVKDNNGNTLYPYTWDVGARINKVKEGETKLICGYYLDTDFMNATTKDNIWQILRKKPMLVVEVTNGEETAETVPRKVIYANEFDPQSFDIKYKVFGAKSPVSITLKFEDGRTAESFTADLENENDKDKEFTSNVRHGFTLDGKSGGALDPSRTVRKVTITATDDDGKTGSAEVYVIVREAFMLN